MASVWDYIEIETTGTGDCNNCGQEIHVTLPHCKMCDQNMNTVILPLCRSFLAKQRNEITDLKNQTKGDIDKLQDKTKLREVAIAKVLDRFPFDLAARTSKFQRALDTEGVWFAHMCCYLMIKNLRPIGTDINELVRDPLYKMMREQFYEFLHKGEKSLDKDSRETIMNVYSIPKAQSDGRKVVLSMIHLLEQQEKLQIYREKNKCIKCGAECQTGQMYCTECEDEEMLKNRQSIASTMPAPLLQPDTPPISSQSSGMHMRKDS